MAQMHNRIAFYPCCGKDIITPRRILKGFVEEIIFCDIKPALESAVAEEQQNAPHLPYSRYIYGDARGVVLTLPRIDVLFHRNDSWGEGGSGVPVLSNHFLPLVLERMPAEGGLIITDGSNSLQSWIERISRPQGVERIGWSFKPSERYPDGKIAKLWVIEARRSE